MFSLSDNDEQESITGILSSRKRGYTGSLVQSSKGEREERDSKKHLKIKDKKKKLKNIQWSVSVTEISNDIQGKSQDTSEVSNDVQKMSEDRPEVPEEAVTAEDKKSGSSSKTGIAAFLPPQHSLWSWADQGWRVSSKSRRVFHKSIKAGGGESLHTGDCAVFLSTSRPDRPYIGRIHSMWATTAGNMKVQVRWFYHPAEVEGSAEGGGRVEDLSLINGLFASSHTDENDVQTISHKCHLLDMTEYKRRLEAGNEDTEDLYYLAGDYDPVVGTINFKPGVLNT